MKKIIMKKIHLDENLIHSRIHDAFQSGKSSHEAAREICSELGEKAVSQKICAKLYETFRKRNINLNDESHHVTKKLEDDELIRLLNKGIRPEDCAKQFGVPLPTIWKQIGEIEEQGIILPKLPIGAKKFEDNDLIELLNKNLSIKKCAEILVVHVKSVRERIGKLERQSNSSLNIASKKKCKDDELIQLVIEGISEPECAERLGTTTGAIHQRKLRLIKEGRLPNSLRKRHTKFSDEDLIQPLNEDISRKECAKQFGVDEAATSKRKIKLMKKDIWQPNALHETNKKFKDDDLIQMLHQEPRSTIHEYTDQPSVSHFVADNPSEKHEIQGFSLPELSHAIQTSSSSEGYANQQQNYGNLTTSNYNLTTSGPWQWP